MQKILSGIKQKLFSKWNLPRFFYLLLGIMVIIQSFIEQRWPGLLAGVISQP